MKTASLNLNFGLEYADDIEVRCTLNYKRKSCDQHHKIDLIRVSIIIIGNTGKEK